MTLTTDVDFLIIEENQNSKEVVVNGNMVLLDKNLAATTDIDTAAGGTIAVTKLQFQENARLRLTGAPAGAFTLEVETVRGIIIISNTSGQTAIVQMTATPGETVAIPDGETKMLYGTSSPDLDFIDAGIGGLLDQGLKTTDDPTFGEITASIGINLGGTAAANMLDDYEEGVWTPAQAGVSLTITTARYTKIGRQTVLELDVTWPSTADTTAVSLTGLPFVPLPTSGQGSASGFTTNATLVTASNNASGIQFYNRGGTPSLSQRNIDLTAKRVIITIIYNT